MRVKANCWTNGHGSARFTAAAAIQIHLTSSSPKHSARALAIVVRMELRSLSCP